MWNCNMSGGGGVIVQWLLHRTVNKTSTEKDVTGSMQKPSNKTPPHMLQTLVAI